MITSPVLVRPDAAPLAGSPRTQLINGSPSSNVPGSPISVDLVHMPPGHVDEPRHHNDIWVYLLVWRAGPLGAIIRHGPAGSEINPSTDQLVAIPPGVTYTLRNPSDEHDVVAYEFRATATVAVPATATPTLIRTDHHEFALSQQGQPIATVLDGGPDGNVPGSPVSAGLVRMRPDHVAEPHHHSNTWIYVLLRHAGPLGAITLHGPALEGRIHQTVGQLVAMPPAEAHAAVNPSPTHNVVAYEFRANPTIDTDNIVLDELRSALDDQKPVLFDPSTTHAR
jgi:uncharacterized RmlC-like cupin family protein/mannose-6-phosphate isomerase-like protein (cupin superfamily)